MSRVEVIGNATHIYALCDEAGQVRYIGKTVRTIDQRLSQHRTAAKRSRLPVGRWLMKHPAATVKLLEVVPPGGDWASRERAWIQRHDNLLNLTEGGEGLAGHSFSAAHRKRISDALKTGAEFACEVCATAFWRKRREIVEGNCRFCSRECYARSLKGVPRPVPQACTDRGVAAAAVAKRAATHCKRGHQLSGQNLFITSGGSRGCKEREPKYFDIACRRIEDAQRQGRLIA